MAERIADLREHYDTADTSSDMEGGRWELDVDGWGGWSISGHPEQGALHIGPLPERKRIALYKCQGNSFSVLAYFRDETSAKAAAVWLDCVMAKANACAGLIHKLMYSGGVTS
jgi:hypothetical protein